MKICGVICEYNPFHNGHKYMLDRARAESGCDYLICIMSGNFTQRGEIAVCDKFTRAEWAVRGGADAVIELPAAFAVSPAELFAKGAVKLMTSLSCFDCLAFGAESGSAESFISTAKALSEENRDLKGLVKEKLKQGLSLVRARSEAIAKLEPQGVDVELLNAPNNILGVEYQKALLAFASNAKILPVRRVGAGYSDISRHTDYSSAAGIRAAVQDKKYRFVRKNIPEYVFKDADKFASPALYKKIAVYSVLSKSAVDLKKIADCTEGLENRIQALAKDTSDYDALIEKITTKRYISSRIRRIFAASALNIDEDVDFEHHVIHVHHAIHYESNQPILGDPKTEAGEREIPLLSILENELRGLHGLLAPACKNGGLMSESAFSSAWNSYLGTCLLYTSDAADD